MSTLSAPIRKALLNLGMLWLKSWRIHWEGSQPLPEKGIFLLWHEHLPICIRAFRDLGTAVLISSSEDGEWAAQACRRMGYQVSRGSSSQGGLSLRHLARILESEKGFAGMAFDGPRGPYRATKPGALWLSRYCGVPIIPVAVRASLAFRLNSWDRTLLPWPGTLIRIRLGNAFIPDTGDSLLAAMRANQEALDG